MTREIIPYALKIQEMFHAHQENNIVAPRGELTVPSPFEFSIPSRARIDGKEKGGSGYYEAVTPQAWRCHHLSAFLNTRWFIHESSLTTITLIRLINGRCRAQSVPPRAPTTLFKRTIYLGGLHCQDSRSSRFSPVYRKAGSLFFSLSLSLSPMGITSSCYSLQKDWNNFCLRLPLRFE